MEEFNENGVFPKGSNSSFIALILKLSEPHGIGYYWPISLKGCMHKVVAKVLARRVRKVFEDVIGSILLIRLASEPNPANNKTQ